VIGDEPANTINDRRRRRLLCRGAKESYSPHRSRAVRLLPVYLAVKPVGEPDAGDRHVRFDERGWETERCRMAQATAPILDSTADNAICEPRRRHP
jgi:hypothetical protein